MSEDHRIDVLIAEARLLERLANSVAGATLIHRAKKPSEERNLWRIVRSQRIQALLAYGRAAALLGCVNRAGFPGGSHS